MYGNRDAGRSKFIAPIADNGIDFVKQILDANDVCTYDGLDENTENNNHNNNIEVKPNLDKFLNVLQEYKAELKYSKLTKFEKEFYTKAINDIKSYLSNVENEAINAPIPAIIMQINSFDVFTEVAEAVKHTKNDILNTNAKYGV